MPRQNTPQTGAAYVQNSPAYAMAARIKSEQGAERAGEYLAAMEPYLAPGERAHIAARLGVPMIVRELPVQPPQYAPSQYAQQNPPQNKGMGDAMQMMQMLSMLSSLGGGKGQGNPLSALGGQGGGDAASIVNLLGGLMGKK